MVGDTLRCRERCHYIASLHVRLGILEPVTIVLQRHLHEHADTFMLLFNLLLKITDDLYTSLCLRGLLSCFSDNVLLHLFTIYRVVLDMSKVSSGCKQNFWLLLLFLFLIFLYLLKLHGCMDFVILLYQASILFWFLIWLLFLLLKIGCAPHMLWCNLRFPINLQSTFIIIKGLLHEVLPGAWINFILAFATSVAW